MVEEAVERHQVLHPRSVIFIFRNAPAAMLRDSTLVETSLVCEGGMERKQRGGGIATGGRDREIAGLGVGGDARSSEVKQAAAVVGGARPGQLEERAVRVWAGLQPCGKLVDFGREYIGTAMGGVSEGKVREERGGKG